MFRKLREQPFIGSDVTSDVYEWTLNFSDIRRFTTLFVVPQMDFPRRFFEMNSLHGWMALGHDPDFLETACTTGLRLWVRSHRLSETHKKCLSYMLAIFRHRKSGHHHVGNQFESSLDFFDFDYSRKEAELLVPGQQSTFQMRCNDTRRKVIQRELKRDPGQNTFEPPRSQIIRGVHEVTKAGPLSLELPVIEYVRSSLIYCPTDNLDNGTGEEIPQDVRDHFMDRIERSFLKKKRPVFHDWLDTEIQKGCRRLLPDSEHLRGAATWAPAILAKTLWRDLLWRAYRTMGVCYGELMVHALNDLRADPAIRASEVELLLFQQMHLPQPYLAKLPLSFLGRPQFTFIAMPLLSLWRNLNFDERSYARVSEILGVFADLVRRRREADCRRYARERGSKETLAPSAESDLVSNGHKSALDEVCLDDETREFTDPYCPHCGSRLSLSETRPCDDELIFVAFCATCDEEFRYRVKTDRLKEMLTSS